MASYSVTDLRHLEPDSPDVSLSARSLRIRKFFGEIARAGSVRPSGSWAAAALRCRRRPGRKPCRGWLQVQRLDIPAKVEWRCPRCGDGGEVSGWKDSPWDLGERRADPPGDPEGAQVVEVRLADREYALLKDSVLLLDEASERVVAEARPEGRDHVLLSGPLADWEVLVGNAAFEANHTENPRLRARLDAVCEQIGTVVEEETGYWI